MSRFTKPLNNDTKLSFPSLRAMTPCLEEMAAVRGVSRAELLRRIVCRSIIDDAPAELGKISIRQRDEIESLGGLL